MEESRRLELEIETIDKMIDYHKARLAHYVERREKMTMKLNRARRLERGVAL